MIIYLKKVNFILKKNGINLIKSFLYFFYIYRRFKNHLKFLLNPHIDNLYIPTVTLKRTIYIDPNKIEFINSIPMKFVKSTKFVLDFDWDKWNKNLKTYSHPTFETCHQLFVERKQIEECQNYKNYMNLIEKNKTPKGFKNHQDIFEYYKKKIDLFKSIKKLGVLEDFQFNIQTIIDRNYNLVKVNSGNHRLAISRMLKLKKIPVEVKVIHSNCFNQDVNQKNSVKKINDLIKKIEKKYS